MKLTNADVARLTLPDGKTDHVEWDDDLPGFGLRLRGGGSRNFVFQYRIGRHERRITIGKASAVSAKDARAAAGKLYLKVKLGQDPALEKAKAAEAQGDTLGAWVEIYLERQRQRLKPRSFVEVQRHLRVHAKSLHRLPVAEIDRRALAKLFVGLGETSGPVAASLVRKSLSAFFGWSMREGAVDANVVLLTNKFHDSRSRERVLTDSELRAVWASTGGRDQYGAIVRLLLLTGARRNEIGDLRWSEVNLSEAVISLPAARTKNSRAFDIPLNPAALSILETQPRQPDRDLIFGRGPHGYRGWAQGKAALDRRIKIEPAWTLHDLRRTMSTRMHEQLALAPHLVEALLNHVSGHKGGVAGVYNKATYAAEKRQAILLWAEHITALVGERPGKIVALRA
jgi:integrase